MTKSKIVKYIIVLILGILAGITISAFPSSNLVDPNINKKVDSLTNIINIRNDSINKLEQSVANYKFKITQIDSQLVVKQQNIKRLNKKLNEKINAVDSLTSDELYTTITNRYSN